ncbi:MAG: CinA family nicotinamide mononucleotide deamidase-related protein, partial [Dehalococcoidia bacterium]|nr:CinA family nicotinamide mononucleotide deamidase-related protein [Dehalococcoidia bacterium]
MRAEILSIGTEIMLGEIVDTNAAWIAARLPQFGIDLLYVSQVGDNPGRMREVIARAWGRAELVIATGGLGPTEDDITRELVAEVLGEALAVDPEQERAVRAWFAGRNRAFEGRNLKQAMLIPSARALANPRGTAPGWWVERDGRVLVLMPGVPPEMFHMWETHVAPELERHADSVLVTRTLKTVGMGEGSVDARLSPLLGGTNPSIGIYARPDGVHARIAAKARTREEARALIAPVEAEARRLLGPIVWGVDDETLAGAIGRLLRERGLTLAVMESATGGAIADAITSVDGSSDYFRGSLVTYAAAAKVAFGVPAATIAAHGVIARETAEAMAHAARERLGADLGVGLTGIASGEAVE